MHIIIKLVQKCILTSKIKKVKVKVKMIWKSIILLRWCFHTRSFINGTRPSPSQRQRLEPSTTQVRDDSESDKPLNLQS